MLRVRIALAVVTLLICTIAAVRELAAWRSGMLAQQRNPDDLRAALKLTPKDAANWRLLGIALLEKDTQSSADAFCRAVALNPYETDALLGLALQAEANQNILVAESLYKRATQSSRRFRPAYALAAFYARARRVPEFWRAAAAAAAIDKADIARILDLAREVSEEPDSLPVRLNLRTEHALATYLRLAMAENRPVPIADVAMRLPATTNNHVVLSAACDRLIEAGSADAAVRVWNRLGAFPPLDVAAGRSLTNPGFSVNPLRGFNWQLHPAPGVHLRPASMGLRIEFSGEQSEHILMLQQVVPVLAGRNYQLTVRSEAPEISTTAGLSWQAQCVPSRDSIGSAPLANASVKGTSVNFSPPPGCDLARLMLVYNREPGTVRISGTLDLISAELELLP